MKKKENASEEWAQRTGGPSSASPIERAELRAGSGAGAIGQSPGLSAVGVAEGRGADSAAPESKAMPSRGAPTRSAQERPVRAAEAARSDDEYAPSAAAAAAPQAGTKSARVEVANEAMGYELSARVDAAARARAEALSRQALAANRAGARQQEVEYLRQALATGVSDAAMVTPLLLRLCDAQLALGNVADGEAACERVVREFPSSNAAQVASRRLAESRARRAKMEPAAPASTVPAETP
jgi:hypothetical protein